MKFILAILLSTFAISCASNAPKESSNNDKNNDVAKETMKKDEKPMEKASAGTVNCAQGDDKRSIEVIKTNSGCEVAYVKFGETKTVASSVNGTEHCESVQQKMKTNLTSAGFTCN
ncbi:MAG: hypothetical protein R2827_08485 [Bdellovibrionales bacterium]